MPTSRITLDPTQYVLVNTGLYPIIVEAAEGVVHVAVTENQPALTNKAFHRVNDSDRLELTPNTNVWVLATNDNQKAVITDSILPIEGLFGGRFDLAVAAGLVPGAESITKFGVNAAAPLNVKIDLWDVGGDYTFLTAAETLNIQSTDADDNSAGTGARTMEIFGLDTDYLEVSELITLNGTTSVPTVNQYLRLNRMIIRSAGANEGAGGTITAESATTTQAQINNGFNQTLMAIWTVPAGKSFIIKYTEASIGRGKEGLFELKIRPFGEVFQTKKALKVYEKKSATRREFGGLITEKSDIKIDVTSDSNNAFVEGEFEGIILDNAIYGLD